ncbi:MAG: protein kinase, partial [Deltaproteobacteria bacterium]|nr:protein kinase [Deltaproteobacteria bacterium]
MPVVVGGLVANQPAPPGYRVVRPLGAGGMGAVYEVEKLTSGQRFAMKLIRPELAESPGFAARFGREVAILQTLRHPNVVQVFESSLEGPTPFCVMEMLAGSLLEDVLRRKRVLPPAEAVRILLQVLDGLAAAHEVGVIHRDVAPSNVFLVGYETGVVNVKLLDFGLASTATMDGAAAGLTMAGVFVGRPSYAAPEGYLGRTVDARADVFSAGVVLFRMLSGRIPWAGRTGEDVLRERWERREDTDEFVAPGDFPPHVPTALVRVVQRSITREPADRYATAVEFQERLRAVQAGLTDRVGSNDPTIYDVAFAVPRAEASDPDGWTPLVRAATEGGVERVAELLRGGADPRAATTSGLSPLGAAAFVGDLDAVRLLHDAGADPDAVTVDGWTPLKLAAIWSRTPDAPEAPGVPPHIVGLARRAPGSPSATPWAGRTVGALRRRGRHGDVIRYLVEDARVSVNRCGAEGLTALMVASWYGGVETVRYLLEDGADPHRVTRDGAGALLMACYRGWEEVARTLVGLGVSPSAEHRTAAWSVWLLPLDFAGGLVRYDAQSLADAAFLGHAGLTPLHAAVDAG